MDHSSSATNHRGVFVGFFAMPIYRAFPVDQAGHIFAEPKEFEAKDDIEAIARAMTFADSHAVEVWDTARRVGLIELRPPEE